MLLAQLKSDARAAGYRTMCLETASFMRDAHKLYRVHGFRVREAYRTVPERFADATLWRECVLE